MLGFGLSAPRLLLDGATTNLYLQVHLIVSGRHAARSASAMHSAYLPKTACALMAGLSCVVAAASGTCGGPRAAYTYASDQAGPCTGTECSACGGMCSQLGRPSYCCQDTGGGFSRCCCFGAFSQCLTAGLCAADACGLAY